MNFQNTLGMIAEIKVIPTYQYKRRITLEALTILEEEYQGNEVSLKSTSKPEQKSNGQSSKHNEKNSRQSKNHKNKRRRSSTSSDQTSSSSSQPRNRKLTKHAKQQSLDAPSNKKLQIILKKSVRSPRSTSAPRRENTLIQQQIKIQSVTFKLDSKPLDCPDNFMVSYQLVGEQQRRVTRDKQIMDKLQNLNKPGENVEIPDQQLLQQQEGNILQQNIAQELGFDQNIQTRYYQTNPFEYCFRCKLPGHMERQCPQDNQIKCNLCLSDDHTADKCNFNACFRCHRSGHRKLECQVYVPRLSCQNCRFPGHSAELCGMLLPMRYHRDKSQIQCIICNQFGHISCKQTTDKDDLFELMLIVQ